MRARDQQGGVDVVLLLACHSHISSVNDRNGHN